MPDGSAQARPSRIMRLQPHDHNGRPCLPTYHRRSRLRWPNWPAPTPSSRPRPRTCSPTWPPSPDRDHRQPRRRAIAVDGKTLRGARTPDGRQVHLLAAMDHTTRAVLAQRQVDGAPGEVPAFQPLLDGLDLASVVVTADALQTHADAAEFLVTGKQAHYLFVVKANQPTLLDRCARLAWHNVPVADRTRDQAHGRVELRTLKAVTVGHFGFRTPLRSCNSPARPATLAPAGGTPWSSTRSPASPLPRPALPGSPTSSAATGRSRTACTGSGT